MTFFQAKFCTDWWRRNAWIWHNLFKLQWPQKNRIKCRAYKLRKSKIPVNKCFECNKMGWVQFTKQFEPSVFLSLSFVKSSRTFKLDSALIWHEKGVTAQCSFLLKYFVVIYIWNRIESITRIEKASFVIEN